MRQTKIKDPEQLIEKGSKQPSKIGKVNSAHAKKRILLAASELFALGGISALSVRSIADAAGVSTIGIYSHFNGKQGILDALFIEGYQMVHDTMAFSTVDLSARQILLKGVRGYLTLANQYEGHYRLIFGENGNQYEPSDEAREMSSKAFKRLVSHSCIILPPNSPWPLKQKIALDLWAFMHGYVSLKHHATSAMISEQHWQEMAVEGISIHIDALIAKYPTSQTK